MSGRATHCKHPLTRHVHLWPPYISSSHISCPAHTAQAAHPWFVFQTIGGAVATGTHGASLPYGSMSAQLLGVELVVANGRWVLPVN